MSLNKAIKHKKEKRKEYRGAKAVATSCRNHGACDYCRRNRLHKYYKSEFVSRNKLKEYFSICS